MSGEVDAKRPEARVSPRRRMLKAGVIAFNEHFMTQRCTVREVSETGARLRVDDITAVPDRFDLIIELDGLEYGCETVWRRKDEVGVRFTSPPRQKAPTRTQVVCVVRPDHKPSLRRKT